jgi:hypothetical protein
LNIGILQGRFAVSLGSASFEELYKRTVADFRRANRGRCFQLAGSNKPEEVGGLKRWSSKHSVSVSFRPNATRLQRLKPVGCCWFASFAGLKEGVREDQPLAP